MSMSPKQLEAWSRQRVVGQRAFQLRSVLISAAVFAILQSLLTMQHVGDVTWKGIVFMTVFFGVGMYFISGAVWQRNEADYSKLSNRGA